MNRKIGACLFFFYVLFVVYNTLLPFRFDRGWQNLGTQIHQIRWHPPSSNQGSVSLTDIAGNIILFVPFGSAWIATSKPQADGFDNPSGAMWKNVNY